MTLGDLLNVVDEKEALYVTYKAPYMCVKEMKDSNQSILLSDMEVKSIKMEGCSVLFVTVE